MSQQKSPSFIYLYTSRAFERLVSLAAFTRGRVIYASSSLSAQNLKGVLAWGRKPSAGRSKKLARKLGLPLIQLEDGFLRSFGPGNCFPPLSIVFDDEGIYYDCTSSSALETLLNSSENLLLPYSGEVENALACIRQYRISKYNDGKPFKFNEEYAECKKILVLDQTRYDLSVLYGGADEASFHQMLQTARNENPGALIIVKTHPEVSSGRKKGYLTDINEDEHTVVLREKINAIDLLTQVDHVYVVTSQMGFEALLLGKRVSVFGIPWYAGWGVTDDRQSCTRRIRKRSVKELFVAAYFRYARYLQPETLGSGDVTDAIRWLIKQQEMAERFPARMICIGFRRWKAANIKPILSLFPEKVIFVPDAQAAEVLMPQGLDCLVHWGHEAPPGIVELAQKTGVRRLRMEDGFIRSVGLGSDLIRPLSLVMDESGIYFDPSGPSDLENLLNNRIFSENDIRRARKVREFIVENAITKYNIDEIAPPQWPSEGREVVLVTGQVEDDASIKKGCDGVRTNLELLKSARRAHPSAFIVYKPHPDVQSSNRKGHIPVDLVRKYADHVELNLSIVSCIEACDALHTMTSLSGFDALLHNKRVVVYGRPFYAGWGLTEDHCRFQRRLRTLELDELVAGVLLHYPLYWDWDLKGYTTCEAVLNRIVAQRTALIERDQLKNLKAGYIRRQFRKARILLRAWKETGKWFK